MRCLYCGYEGVMGEFEICGYETTCCSSTPYRQCPKCGKKFGVATFSEPFEEAERLRQICQEIRESLDQGDLEKVSELRSEAMALNEDLGFREEREFLAQVKRALAERGYVPGKVTVGG